MSGLFSSPKVPKPKPPPSVAQSEGVQAAADAERRRQRLASGRASTMLSDQENMSAPMVGTRKLLG